METKRKIMLSDITLCGNTGKEEAALSFKEKIEAARLLDRLCIDVIEVPALSGSKADALFLHTIAPLLHNSVLCCPVNFTENGAKDAWEAIRGAAKPRLQISLPTSTVGMEYSFHKKPKAMLDFIKEQVSTCKAICPSVEFIALDSTRSDFLFLCDAIRAAVEAGADVVTLDDTAGSMLVYAFGDFVAKIRENIPELSEKKVILSVKCTNEYYMAMANAFAAIKSGADQIKVSVSSAHYPSIKAVSRAVAIKSGDMNITCGTNTAELENIVKRIKQFTGDKKHDFSPFEGLSVKDDEVYISPDASFEEVCSAAQRMGYDLGDEDKGKVYAAFKKLAGKKKSAIYQKELDVIISTEALQVPSVYNLVSYVINSGNIINSTASIELEVAETGERLRGLSSGDGAIDASFMALEQITGHHYELDDFQIQSVTDGREAVGEAVVKLRADGKLYSGRGISTDIIGAGIRAYVNALNKIRNEQK